MKIKSPPNLHYPITVTELVKKRDDDIDRSTPLFKYYYETTVSEGDGVDEVKDVKRRFPARFDSSAAGKISQWFIKSGTVIQRSGSVPASMSKTIPADCDPDLISLKSRSHARTKCSSVACVPIAAKI
jgi:RNA polymerase II subunit A-like phosphatase